MDNNLLNLSVSDLTRLLVNASDREVNEFNEVFDKMESATAQVEALQKEIAGYVEMAEQFNTLKQQCDTVYKNGENHLNAAKQAYRERDQMKDKLDTANELLSTYKAIDTAKKIREKFKNYQKKAAENAAAIRKSKDLIKDYRKEIDKHVDEVQMLKLNEKQTSMSSIWSEDGDNLMLFPARLTMQIGDTQEKQMTLLYMTKSGCGKLIAIDEEGNPVECTLPEGGLHPKPKTLEVAGELLRKWRRQGWKIELSDLDLSDK